MAVNVQFTNFATGSLSAGINNAATSLTLNSGQGALFPTLTGSLYFYAVITDAITKTVKEVIKVTARTGDSFGTIVRAQDGTTAQNWLAGDIVELRLVNAALVDLAAQGGVAYLGIPQNSQSTNYTTVLADQSKHILHPSADVTARTFTIDSNANVPYPIGTAITFVNQNGAGVVTIAITADTMRLAGAGTTGSRTLAANGIATALKITSTEWIISGTGLT